MTYEQKIKRVTDFLSRWGGKTDADFSRDETVQACIHQWAIRNNNSLNDLFVFVIAMLLKRHTGIVKWSERVLDKGHKESFDPLLSASGNKPLEGNTGA
jgi:hypothetical protein